MSASPSLIDRQQVNAPVLPSRQPNQIPDNQHGVSGVRAACVMLSLMMLFEVDRTLTRNMTYDKWLENFAVSIRAPSSSCQSVDPSANLCLVWLPWMDSMCCHRYCLCSAVFSWNADALVARRTVHSSAVVFHCYTRHTFAGISKSICVQAYVCKHTHVPSSSSSSVALTCI